MLHQVMHTGNIKTGNKTVINENYIRLIIKHTLDYGYTGITLYSDGSFLTLYEGELDCIEQSRQRYNDTSLYSNILTMFSRPIRQRDFTGYRVGLGKQDSLDNIVNIKGCFHLTPETLNTVIPASLPEEFKILTRTFARINNLATA